MAMIFAPWLLLAYGRSFLAGEIPIIILLATGIIHMSGAPAAQRLSITGLRATRVINGIWAVMIIGLGIWLVPRLGATGAAAAFLIAHATTSLVVVLMLAWQSELPAGYAAMFIASTSGALGLVGLGFWRVTSLSHGLSITITMLVLYLLLVPALWQIGLTTGCLPSGLPRNFRLARGASLSQNDLARP
jgi:hypothetical protein